MRITVVGKGNVGGGLADLWERAGHNLTRLGRGRGDVSDADVVLVAVPGDAIRSRTPPTEARVKVVFAIGEGLGPFLYRMATVDEL